MSRRSHPIWDFFKRNLSTSSRDQVWPADDSKLKPFPKSKTSSTLPANVAFDNLTSIDEEKQAVTGKADTVRGSSLAENSRGLRSASFPVKSTSSNIPDIFSKYSPSKRNRSSSSAKAKIVSHDDSLRATEGDRPTLEIEDAVIWSKAVMDQAKVLGIHPVEDNDLIWIAEDSISAPLPAGWEEHSTDDGLIFYYNTMTDVSSWSHPLDNYYKHLVAVYKNAKEGLEIVSSSRSHRPAEATEISGAGVFGSCEPAPSLAEDGPSSPVQGLVPRRRRQRITSEQQDSRQPDARRIAEPPPTRLPRVMAAALTESEPDNDFRLEQ